jgi:mannosyltransferase OCH1-like enzyme
MDALAKFGGVYLDTDVDLIRSLEPMLENRAFLGFQRGDDYPHELVNGAVFGAEPGHWLPVVTSRFNQNSSSQDT